MPRIPTGVDKRIRANVVEVDGFELDLVAAIGSESDLDLQVTADVVVIRGRISCPGKSVSIVARKIVGLDGATLDVSGRRSAGFAAGHRADDGTSPGQSGSRGAAGPMGENGGSIELDAEEFAGAIALRADGGDGGRGQDGGHGAAGTVGADGGEPRHGGDGDFPGSPGLGGGPGGNAGGGGDGGDGGSGGRIAARFVIRPAAGAILLSTNGGAAGQGGTPGSPGNGGTGGRGGRNFYCSTPEHHGPREP